MRVSHRGTRGVSESTAPNINLRGPSGVSTRGFLYLCCGATSALVFTLGLVALRVTTAPGEVTADAELSGQPWLYLYAFGFNLLLFGGFGAWAGHREDILRAQSTTDPLTGLVNRRYFNERLNSEIKRCSRSSAPLALLLIDVDRLKKINDTQGHSAGDAMLRAVAGCIKQVCRATDVLARIGGDEFAVLAPATTARQAVELAGRLRTSIKSYSTQGLPITVSIGVSDLDQVASQRPEALLGAADMALYAAKDGGRDRVFLNNTTYPRTWTALPDEPGLSPQDAAAP